MKPFLFAIALFVSISSSAQIQSADLTASGLTCSMCSKAIYKSLVKVPTIQKVTVDIKNSSYLITFKQGQGMTLSLEAIKKAVEDAGFSVAALKVTANFGQTKIGPDTKISLQGSTYQFLNSSQQTIQGVRTFAVVDKNYLPAQEHKKYAKSIPATAGGSVYHVTLL